MLRSEAKRPIGILVVLDKLNDRVKLPETV